MPASACFHHARWPQRRRPMQDTPRPQHRRHQAPSRRWRRASGQSLRTPLVRSGVLAIALPPSSGGARATTPGFALGTTARLSAALIGTARKVPARLASGPPGRGRWRCAAPGSLHPARAACCCFPLRRRRLGSVAPSSVPLVCCIQGPAQTRVLQPKHAPRKGLFPTCRGRGATRLRQQAYMLRCRGPAREACLVPLAAARAERLTPPPSAVAALL